MRTGTTRTTGGPLGAGTRWATTALAGILLAAAPGVASQDAAGPPPPEGACGCLADFDALTRVVEESYIGFALLDGARRPAWEEHRDGLRARAAETDGAQCVFVVRELTDWFGDGHLFVAEAPPMDPAATAAAAAGRERVATTEAEAVAYLDARAASGPEALDPIEGLWYDRGLRVAVIRDAGPERDFVAVTLASDAPGWEPGMVRAEFRGGDGVYETVLYADDHSTRHPAETRIRKGALLHMAPVTWGKAYPVTRPEQTWLDPDDPRAPTFRRLDEDAVLVSVPSHDPARAGDALRALVERHGEAMAAARTLVIDVRGNEGGSSFTTRPLAPFYWADAPRPPLIPQGDSTALLASPHALAEAEANVARNPNLPDAILAVVEEMRSRPGEVVAVHRSVLGGSGLYRPDTVHTGPERVAVLMDDGVVSAGESFVLEAGRSRRVTLFGQSTGGVYDFQNVKMRRLACPGRGLWVGVPEFAGSHLLAGHPINGVGIPPRVVIDEGVEDPVAFVLEWYRDRDRANGGR